ncbi:MAG: glycosyltransferase involved in cell wall biosynthesis [Planctomycetota bacterium]|jgi:glycosyltransferase involved in cell wall biosynthesis
MTRHDALFVRLCNRPIPRVLRMMHVARELGLRPLFVGAHREAGLPAKDQWDGWEVHRIGPFFPLVNGTKALLYVWSVFVYGWALFAKLLSCRPAVVHVSDFEVFWPARIYTALTRTPLIYNIHDNLSQRYQCPASAAAVLNMLEGLAAWSATATVVPEPFRRTALPSWCRSNVHVVKNAPFDPGFRPPTARADESRVNVLFAGWIDIGRGIRPLTEMVGKHEACHLILAGEGDAALVEESASSTRVDYRGYLKNELVITETESCDFVAALYDPVRPINCFAASNKIAEALAVGRPLIVNAEQEIAALLEKHDCAVIVPYAEATTLGPKLAELRDNQVRYEAMCRRARDLYEEQYAWEIILESSVSLYAAAGVTQQQTPTIEVEDLEPVAISRRA